MDTTPTAPVPTTGAAPISTLGRATLLASATLTIMAAAVIAPSLPEMLQVFADVPRADVLVRLVLTVTSLTIGLTAPLAGLVADRVGRTPLLVSSLVLYAAAGAAGFFTTDLVAVLVSRALLGVAVGGVMTAVSALIADSFQGPARARFLGLQSAFASLGGVVFLPLAGVLAGIGWNAPFWIYAVSALIVPFAVLSLREPVRARSRVTAGDAGTAPAGRPGSAARGIAAVYALAFAGTLIFFMAPTQLPFSLERFAVTPSTTGLVIAGARSPACWRPSATPGCGGRCARA
jgi:MFS family permease